jgi:(R,R)-butanediol dehydrogenase / meso-butanediol dehydrogenase / diacetyl reductase
LREETVMKAVVYHGGTGARYEELAMPALSEGEVLVKVAYAGVCGSDVTIYSGKHKRVKPPVVIGHEVSGEVAAVNAPGSDIEVGSRVVVEPLMPCGQCYACASGHYNACKSLRHLGIDVNGMFAEYVKALAHRVYRVPDGVSLRAAALVEPTAVAVHALRLAGIGLGERVAVLGAGPIGLLSAQVARVATSMPVELVDVSSWRLDLATRLGFDPIDARSTDVVAELVSRTGGRGVDILVDTAGVAAAAAQLVPSTRIHGRIVMLAMPKDGPLPVDLGGLAMKEQRLIGSRAYMRPDYETAISLIAAKSIDAELTISHVMPLDGWQDGLELAKKADASMKILLHPGAAP